MRWPGVSDPEGLRSGLGFPLCQADIDGSSLSESLTSVSASDSKLGDAEAVRMSTWLRFCAAAAIPCSPTLTVISTALFFKEQQGLKTHESRIEETQLWHVLATEANVTRKQMSPRPGH